MTADEDAEDDTALMNLKKASHDRVGRKEGRAYGMRKGYKVSEGIHV